MILYNEKVLDHFNHPRNVGEIEDADGMSVVTSSRCGDRMQLFLQIDHGVIRDAKFKTFGCSAAIASSSMATEMLIGRTVEEASRITNKDVAEELGGLPAIKVHCSVLAEDGIRAALADYEKKMKEKEYCI